MRSRRHPPSSTAMMDMSLLGLMATLVVALVGVWSGGDVLAVIEAEAPAIHTMPSDSPSMYVPTLLVGHHAVTVHLQRVCGQAGCDHLPKLADVELPCPGGCTASIDAEGVQQALITARRHDHVGQKAVLIPEGSTPMAVLIQLADTVRSHDDGEGVQQPLYPQVQFGGGVE